MVLDTLIQHWVVLVAGEEAVPDGFGRDVQWITMLFHADDGILSSLRLARLHEALDVLMGLFERVVFCINVNKMVGMVYQLCKL